MLTIVIKHGFPCINIRQVPREVLKTKAGGRGFQHLPRDLANVNALKKTCSIAIIAQKLKTFATFRVILVLGPGTTHLVTAAILWPRYKHTESCTAVH